MQRFARPASARLDTPRLLVCLAFLLALLPLAAPRPALAGSSDLTGPAGSGAFGERVALLPNGNLVVTDYLYDHDGLVDAGAAHLYDGTTLQLISTLTSATANSRVGNGGVTVLADGNYLVVSSGWGDVAANMGAVTWCSATAGCPETISAANSLVGSSAEDQIANGGIKLLASGAYLVRSQYWDGAAANVGAVTWCPASGCVGPVSAANSLVGSSADDQVGSQNPYLLAGGGYVVNTPLWDGAAADVGASTWCPATGCVGEVSAANSLVGSSAQDKVGDGGAYTLSSGNYVVISQLWDGAASNVGAATWVDGTRGLTGTVSAANSLVGSSAADQIGDRFVVLSNGNYVVGSPEWDGVTADVGAVTWVDGTRGLTGTISMANSLTGTTSGDMIGSTLTALSNGNYVTGSPSWDGAAANVGVVIWADGTRGITGTVSAANSLTGASAGDMVGDEVVALSNGNYVVGSPSWSGAAVDVGAITWADGTRSLTGTVSAANSLVGSTASDNVGRSIKALKNGNYVVCSSNWDGGAVNVGAVTWVDGTRAITGTVSAANSLVGSTAQDKIGDGRIVALANGNYVVGSSNWDGAAVNAGALTWGDGTRGVTGTLSAANSLVGASVGDQFGFPSLAALADGSYVAISYNVDNGAASNAGALTWDAGTSPLTGTLSASNSVLATTATGGSYLQYAYDPERKLLIVGRGYDNVVTIRTANTLDVSTEGPGTVAVAHGGPSCQDDCALQFGHGARVTLVATPAAGWRFAGWDGACSGTGPCVLALGEDKSVSATFTRVAVYLPLLGA